ncbi:MAG: hypothetical protein LAT62_01070 [Natronospirillum sp.]|uniref:hypothetical protein n=1 Tax=Natronospirillum sp. TaxID=2812955 RepID=UPI0025CC8C59|nr:hypothetical protein [Natronospirillum sp.]MCH8550495.1 hypothetical protein [Natronospirillum sp.]
MSRKLSYRGTLAVMFMAILPGAAIAHECTTTHPLISSEGDGLMLFQTIVEDWDVLRDRIKATGAVTLIDALEANAEDVVSEAVSLTRSAQVEQRVVDADGRTWEFFWGLADHHGDCTEVQVQIRWATGAWTPDLSGEFWLPVQHALEED